MEYKIKFQKGLTLLTLTMLTFLSAFSQSGKTWTKVDKPKQYEITFLKDAGLMIPKTVKRYYKIQNNDTTNYLNEAIYLKDGYLIKGENELTYTYYEVTFFGSEYEFTLNYKNSIGRGYSCQGSFFLEEGVTLQTEYCYGTSSGTITFKRNGKEVYTKQVDTEKQ